MALLTASGYSTSGITSGTQVFDFAPWILANLRLEEATIAHIDIGDPVKDVVGYWIEDQLVGNIVTLTGTLATGGTTLTVAAADLLKIGYNAASALQRPGAILQVQPPGVTTTVTGNGEQVQVTAFGSSTTATITRSYGITQDPTTTYGIGTTLKLVAWPLPEGSNLGPDQSQARTVRYNLTQIFGRDITITRNQIKRGMQSLDDEFYYQLDQRAIEMKREMNDTIIFGSPSTSITGTFAVTPANSGGSRTMAGLLYFLQSAGGSASATATYNTTSEAFTPKALNNMQYASAILGGNPDLMITGGTQQRAFQSFSQDLVRIVPNERVRGAFTTLYRTDMGVVVSVVNDLNMSNGSPDTVMLVDPSRIALHPFVDAEFFMLVAPTFTDGDSARVLGEWTLECRNAIGTLAAHAVHTGLSAPA